MCLYTKLASIIIKVHFVMPPHSVSYLFLYPHNSHPTSNIGKTETVESLFIMVSVLSIVSLRIF